MDQSGKNNYSNQQNPNNAEFGGAHADAHNPSSGAYQGSYSGGCSVSEHVSSGQAANDNHSNQMNPNNDEYGGGNDGE